MSGGGESNADGAAQPVATVTKMIQTVKEIVTNCPEPEIYAMLRDCNMDPNDAVQRLLSQDSFHEVKRKRERRKEIKEPQQLRSRVVFSGSQLGPRGGSSEHNVQYSASAQTNINEHENFACKRQNGSLAPSMPALVSSSSSSQTIAATVNQHPRDDVDPGNKTWPVGSGDALCSSAQTSAGFQPAFSGPSGNVSMADIVRMGRPQGKGSYSEDLSGHQFKHSHRFVSAALESNTDLYLQVPSYSILDVVHKPGIEDGLAVINDESPVSEQPTAATVSSILDASAASDGEMHSHSGNWHSDRGKPSWNCHLDEVEESREDVAIINLKMEENSVNSAFDRQMMVNSAGMESHRHTTVLPKDYCAPLGDDISAEVSSATVNLQQLSLTKEKLVDPHLEDEPAPLIPSHLQVSAADLSHLNFGSYKPRNCSSFSRSLSSNAPKRDSMGGTSVARDGSSVAHLDTRYSYHGEEQLRSIPDAHRLNTDARIHDAPVGSLGELNEQSSPASARDRESIYEASVQSRNFETNQHWASASSHSQVNSLFKDIPLQSAMHAYSNSLLSDSLASNAESFRESNTYASLIAAQLMNSRHNNAVLANSSETVSLPKKLHDTSITRARALAQKLTDPSYSQAAPLGQLTDMMGYPFSQENLGYAPTNQQSYPGSTAYAKSWVAAQNGGVKHTLPQYKSNASLSSLLPFTSTAPGYGGNGNSTNSIEDFLQNPSAMPNGNSLLSGNVLSLQYNGGRHSIPIQQNESFASWLYGPGSRTASAVPASALYGTEGQGQRHTIYQEMQQQLLPHYEALGYPNFYHSQSNIMQEHQQQNPSDLTSTSAQNQSAMQSHQIPLYF